MLCMPNRQSQPTASQRLLAAKSKPHEVEPYTWRFIEEGRKISVAELFSILRLASSVDTPNGKLVERRF